MSLARLASAPVRRSAVNRCASQAKSSIAVHLLHASSLASLHQLQQLHVPQPQHHCSVNRSFSKFASASANRPRLATSPPGTRNTVADADLPAYRKQLLYRSKQRGWLELDLLLGSWAEDNLSRLSASDLSKYDALTQCENPDLVLWIIERQPVPEHIRAETAPVLEQVIAYSQSKTAKQWIKPSVASGNQ